MLAFVCPAASCQSAPLNTIGVFNRADDTKPLFGLLATIMALQFANLTTDYGDVAGEAQACRNDCALFDFSFIERARVEGRNARSVIEAFTGRSLAGQELRQIRYALRVSAAGDLLVDLTVWRIGEQSYEVMSGRREDVHDLMRSSDGECRVTDLTPTTAVLALQGPKSLDVLRALVDVREIEALKYYQFCEARLAGVPCTIGRLGYTGEPGFELVLVREHRDEIWARLAKRARPAGFAAADILRIEAGFALFANEFAVPVSPGEAGLARFHDKAEAPRGIPVRLVCFRATSLRKPLLWRPALGLARPEKAETIAVTSACESAVADGILGLGYVAEHKCTGDRPLYDPAGVFKDIRIVALPFHDHGKRRPRAPW